MRPGARDRCRRHRQPYAASPLPLAEGVRADPPVEQAGRPSTGTGCASAGKSTSRLPPSQHRSGDVPECASSSSPRPRLPSSRRGGGALGPLPRRDGHDRSNGLGAEELVALGNWPLISAVTFMRRHPALRRPSRVRARHRDVARPYAPAATPYEAAVEVEASWSRPASRPELPRPAAGAVVEARLQRHGDTVRGAHRSFRTSPFRRARDADRPGHLVHDLVEGGKSGSQKQRCGAARGSLGDERPPRSSAARRRRATKPTWPSMLEDVLRQAADRGGLHQGGAVREAERARWRVPLHLAMYRTRQGEGASCERLSERRATRRGRRMQIGPHGERRALSRRLVHGTEATLDPRAGCLVALRRSRPRRVAAAATREPRPRRHPP